MKRTIMWFRRDLRFSDNPALLAALDAAGADGAVVALFCVDPVLWDTAGDNRKWFLHGCLTDLQRACGNKLVVRYGAPADVVPALAAEVGATRVFAASDAGPYGTRRDEAVAAALKGVGAELSLVGSSYACPPGLLTTASGSPYRVFSAFQRAWLRNGFAPPMRAPRSVAFADARSDELPRRPTVEAQLPEPGEAAAKRVARRFFDTHLDEYDQLRDVPARDATSRLSAYLKWGCIHPRQLLQLLGSDPSHARFRAELCWREFFADVLYHRPDSARQAWDQRIGAIPVDEGAEADHRFAAWRDGQTGYPIVDAGMRQLRAEGWMHNRVRMLTASFLVKDLHLDWHRGARWFMDQLVDADVASNQHGWQWVAGTGTDAAPYFRIFNPSTQGERFDPDGAYVRRWIPELRDVENRYVHKPWANPAGTPTGYPSPIVDHATERAEALGRYASVRNGSV